MVSSLADLKADNAREANAPEKTDLLDDSSAESVDVLDDNAPETPDTPETDHESPSADAEGEQSAPDWLSAAEDDLPTSGSQIPLKKHIEVRSKLKAKNQEAAEKIAALEAKLDALQQGGQSPPAPQPGSLESPALSTKPKLEDFYDAEEPTAAYADALFKYQRQEFDRALAEQRQQAVVQSRQELEHTRTKQAVDSHYERAKKLVESGDVTEERYQTADGNIRSLIESMFPNQGDATTDALLARLNDLGDGSEKVWFRVGDTPKGLQTLKRKLEEDSTGISAAMWLGTIHARLGSPTMSKSNAPRPGTSLKGDTAGGERASDKALKKQYDKACTDGNIQQRISIRQEAKRRGIDVKNW